MNTGWWEIDIHGCKSVVKIAFALICSCNNNRGTSRHNASTLRSRDVADQPWWRFNAKLEKTVLGGNGEMSKRWLFFSGIVCPGHKKVWKNKICSLPWIPIFWSLVMWFANAFHSWLRHSWKSLVNRFTREQKIGIHCNSCIVLYIWYTDWFSAITHIYLTSDS